MVVTRLKGARSLVPDSRVPKHTREDSAQAHQSGQAGLVRHRLQVSEYLGALLIRGAGDGAEELVDDLDSFGLPLGRQPLPHELRKLSEQLRNSTGKRDSLVQEGAEVSAECR